MGLAFEILFIFIGVNYIGASLISDKMSNAGRKYQREIIAAQRAAEDAIKEAAEIETKTRREYADGIEGVVIREIEDHTCFRIEHRQEMEQECLRVFKTLPSWNRITEWNAGENEWTYCISELVYFANRGKIPIWLLSFDPKVFSYLGIQQGGHELMLWWRDKLHSFGFYHELWFCYDGRNGEKCKCEVEYSKAEILGGRKYYWDTEFNAISCYQTIAPENMKGLPFSISESTQGFAIEQ